MATVRPGTFPAIKMPRDAQIIPENIPPSDQISLLEYTPFTQGKPLAQADIIIAGGLCMMIASDLTSIVGLVILIGFALIERKKTAKLGAAA